MSPHEFARLLSERILILDGAMGTMIQRHGLTETDYRSDRFASWPRQLQGNNDLLCLTAPGVIGEIAREYIAAGADIISTNTFNANAISMADYDMEDLVAEINREGARIARRAADSAGRRVLVAGSMGPTNKTASMSADVDDPAARAVSYDDLCRAYATQVEALMEGGVDILLFETVFDTLNLKAGLDAAVEVMERRGEEIPVMVSVTIAGRDGRTFSGQTLEAFIASVSHAPVASVGLNCSFGPAEIMPWLRALAAVAPWPVSCHPNAGLPDASGHYGETPGSMAAVMRQMVGEGLVNIIGGCCGTTPDHISHFPSIVAGAAPRPIPQCPGVMRLSGLDMLEIRGGAATGFVSVGERCNVAGSRKFLRLIGEGNYDEALAIARRQVEDGAAVIDINMDDGLLDTGREMCHFLNLIASEPDIARVPVMVDSSRWEVIEEALKCIQGKGIVNSISLKEGEEVFLERARRIRRLGAAVVVMAFDERGQADTYERRIEVCSRAYRLLTERAAFPPEDIIFDPNVLAIATGMPEHDRYALDFIRATEWIKTNLPGAKVSGGLSNLSFSFRGNNRLREAMHAVFLHHAIAAGMDMAILNPASAVAYGEIDSQLRDLLEDVIMARDPQAPERLAEHARLMMEQVSDKHPAAATAPVSDNRPVEERLRDALVKGDASRLADDIAEIIAAGTDPVSVIDGPLMEGMNRVGTLFGDGKMFLPQVVKTARTMKAAVALLKPEIDRRGQVSGAGARKAGRILFATVRGDVHDIGKNIVSIVLTCNNYEVIDLGVMVAPETIVETALRERPDIVCLSGLITPSLGEMAVVIRSLADAGLDIPVMVGGATTSRLHTALKLDPCYPGAVIHVPDASQNPLIAARLLDPATGRAYIGSVKEEARTMREREAMKTAMRELLPIDGARAHRVPYVGAASPVLADGVSMSGNIPVGELIPLINRRALLAAWSLPASLADVQERVDETLDARALEARRLLDDAYALLRSLPQEEATVRYVARTVEARADGDDIMIGETRFPTLRKQTPDGAGYCPAAADFVNPAGETIGLFAVSVDPRLEGAEGDDPYRRLLGQTVAHRLAEAGSEWLHRHVARAQGIRPAVGYPIMPDQSLNHVLGTLIDMESIGITLTENGAMHPSASVSGLYLTSPSAHYFMVGPIGPDQIDDYARRRSLTPTRVLELLGR